MRELPARLPETPTTNLLETVLANLLLVVLMFPYASPVPIETDVQPFGLVVALASLVILLFVRGYIFHFDRTDLLLLAVAVVYALYADWSVQDLDLQFLRKNAVLVLVFPAYWSAKQLYRHMSSRTVVRVAWVYLGITLAQAFAPFLFRPFAAVFLPRLAAESAGRGLTGPCPEPSFLAYIALAFPIVYKLLTAKETHEHRGCERRRFIALVLVCVALVLLSKSVTGVVFGTVLLAALWVRAGTVGVTARRLVLLILVLGSLTTVGLELVGPRTGRVLRLAFTEPTLILRDASIASRYVQVVAGSHTALTRPLGTGKSVGAPEVFERAAADLEFDRYIPARSMEYIRQNRLENGYIPVLSPVGDSLARMGLLFVAIIVVVLAIMRAPASRLASRIFLVLGIVSSFPLAFPIFWLMLGAHEGWYVLRRLRTSAPAQVLAMRPT